MTSVLRTELNELAEFMFLLQQPEAYKKWKEKQEMEKEERKAAEEGDYEYYELPPMRPKEFDKLMTKLQQTPLDLNDSKYKGSDLIPITEEEFLSLDNIGEAEFTDGK